MCYPYYCARSILIDIGILNYSLFVYDYISFCGYTPLIYYNGIDICMLNMIILLQNLLIYLIINIQ